MLWLIGILVAVAGLYFLLTGSIILGIVLIVLGALLVGGLGYGPRRF